jgi:hypothetical protein
MFEIDSEDYVMLTQAAAAVGFKNSELLSHPSRNAHSISPAD